MGREIKRVPLDFDWPIKKIWYGYAINYCLDGGIYRELTCDDCKKFGKLIGISDGKVCPDFPRFNPPEGEGYQMWETTSEGSPISPVFKTPEELAKWLVDNKASSFGRETATYEQWLSMCKQGWAPSMVMVGGKLISGVEDASRE